MFMYTQVNTNYMLSHHFICHLQRRMMHAFVINFSMIQQLFKCSTKEQTHAYNVMRYRCYVT